ncbi:hypothetical protein [Kribbella jiaozuonensis]|uniref:Uncharacterized protein n=1 Tax=Kribbella jiaozuonensis TaxID=2575441 RepID=A0A4U3LVG2_9ACTN|nr:hypothetical protein [Kribbella jiaozuonensis]TKK79519.1 hypothetical protein FDA38_14040 [Kribbella jiaozuonensis]
MRWIFNVFAYLVNPAPRATRRARRTLEHWYRAWPRFEHAFAIKYPDSDRHAVKDHYLQCARQVADDLVRRQARTARSAGLAALALIAAGGLPMAFGDRTHPSYLVLGSTWLSVASCVICAALALGALPSFAAVAAVLAALFGLAGISGMLLLPGGAGIDDLSTLLLGADRGSAAVLLIFFGFYGYLVGAIFVLGLFLISVMNRRAEMRMPHVYTLHELVRVVDFLSRPEPFISHRRRCAIVKALHRASRLTRSGLPGSIALPSPAQRAIFSARCQGAADSLESMEIWVALPKADTAAQLSAISVGVGVVLLSGNYDELPELHLPPLTGAERLMVASQIAKSLLIGAIPLLVVVALRWFGIDVDGALGSGLTFFCIAWFAVTSLSLLDPLFSQKLAMVREVMATIRTRADEK